MSQDILASLDFGNAARLDGSLSERARGLLGSEILKIAAEIREIVREGGSVCNLTVGDFNAAQFPIPEGLKARIHAALDAGETNYPPSDGVLALRKAVAERFAKDWGVTYPLASVVIAGGARPILYGAYRCVLDPGDTVVYGVPSWNNNHYAWIAAAKKVELPTRGEEGFHLTPEQIAPYLGEAQMICLCSPSNPTGTVISADRLRAIAEAIVDENRKREATGKRQLFLLFDQVYASLAFKDARHVHPVALCPDVAPYVISLDAVSKSFAATGLRVGWMLAAPPIAARIRDYLGHVGAWAPRPEQVAVAGFLGDDAAVTAWREEMSARVLERLEALYAGFMELKREGLPVDCVSPQGAIYLSMRLDLIGRQLDGKTIETNEEIRQLLLSEAGVAVVPFQAFGLKDETGWFRISVGAVSLAEIRAAFPRMRALLQRVTGTNNLAK
jgi:aspartate aminotransferase